MAESTLTLARDDIRKEVAHFLGYGRTISDWTGLQSDEIDIMVDGGYRQFLAPPPLPEETVRHLWSFLKNSATLTTALGTSDYDLPDDFGGIDGEITFDPNDAYHTIAHVSESRIRANRQREYASGGITGRPIEFAIRPKPHTDLTEGQRHELLFWPDPDAIYVLTYLYNVLPGKLTSTNIYPLGGMYHSETIKQSCLAYAEAQADDQIGHHNQLFMMRLAASVEQDRKLTRPEFYGKNRDMSDNDAYGLFVVRAKGVTVNGTLYP